jgi:predicted PolB exonuclease-like 3'-5' exonuclease
MRSRRAAPVRAPHIGERPEKELITGFVNRIAELSPQLVTFNGSGFDLPVLRYRAMVHAIPAVDGRSVDAGVANQRTGRIRFWPFV